MRFAGIMLLEKQLLEIEGKSQNSRKRAKTSTVPPSEVTTCWIELSKYVSLVNCFIYVCQLDCLLTCVVKPFNVIR